MQELPSLERLFVYDDPVGSEERLVSLAREKAVLENEPYYCELLTRLARSQGLQRRFEDAHATLDQAAKLGSKDPSCQVRIPLERGRVFNSSGDKASAKPLFLEAFQLAQEAGLDELAVDAAHMMGIVEPGQEGLAWNERAIAIAEASDDPKAKKWFGSLYNNTGWTYHDSGQYERALELFVKAMELRVAQQRPEQVRIAEWCVARCLRSLGRLHDSLAIQERLYKEGDESGYGAEELGELHLALGEAQRAGPFFAEAHQKLSQDPWIQANEPQRLERLLSLAG